MPFLFIELGRHRFGINQRVISIRSHCCKLLGPANAHAGDVTVQHIAVHIRAVGPADDAKLGVHRYPAEEVHVEQGRKDAAKFDEVGDVDIAHRPIIKFHAQDVIRDRRYTDDVVQNHGSFSQMELNNPTASESTLRQDGEALRIALPQHITKRFDLHEGDTVYLIETEAGILITPHDAEMREVMEIPARVSARYANALRELGE